MDRSDEGLIVAFHLIGISDGVVSNRFVKMITASDVASDHRCIPCLVVRPGERHPAKPGISAHYLRSLGFDIGRDLHVAELADIKVASSGASRPAEKDVARCLHQPLPDHDALAIVRNARMSRIAFEHRRARLLDLEK